MAEFELYERGRYKATFDADVDPFDERACVDLLRAQARQEGVRPGDAELWAKNPLGRVVRRWRT